MTFSVCFSVIHVVTSLGKVGVEIVLKRPANRSTFPSYLKDLKMRNERHAETPVKRLKVTVLTANGYVYNCQEMYSPLERVN